MKINVKTSLILATFVMLLPVTAMAQGRGGANRPDPTERRAAIEQKVAERKETAAARVAERRAAAEERSAEQLKKVCEKRVERIGSIVSRTSEQASRLLGVMDGFYVKVQGFYDTNQLTVNNYDELAEAVDTAKEAATVEIAALNETNTEIDCSNPEAVVKVAAYRTGANEARDALKEYRRALVELISSMRAAAAEEAEGAAAEEETEKETETEQSESTENESEQIEEETTNEQETE